MAFDEWETQFPYKPPAAANWTTCGVRMGPDGTNALEVVWGSGGSDTVTALRKVWKDRKSSRVNPVVAVHYSDSRALLMGPGREGTDPPARTIGDVDQLAKLLNTALSLPDRHQARRFLDEFLPGVGDPALGVRNSGLLSTHALMRISPQRDDWPQLAVRGKALLDLRRRELMEGLGFTVEQSSAQHSILKVDRKSAAVALFLERDEASDRIIERFGSESPVLYALRIAEREQLEWVVITAGPSVRLYPTSTTVGVGRRGRTETFCEVRLDLLSETNSGYLPLLFSDDALKPEGYLMDLIERSSDHVANLGIRLRERIYDEVIPRLATGIANARNLVNPTATDLRETHDMALTLLFRLLFVSYAEDRVLLPYRENEAYTEIALKTLARRFTDDEQEVEMKQSSTAMWDDVAAIVKAVHDGRPDWSIPPYGGAPFSEAEETSPSGCRLTEISLSDDVFGPVLRGLLVDVGSEGEGPIDFSELSVREFGTVYEGLLESELALAEEDLSEDKKGYYRPSGEKDSVVVSAGSYYLHNSGKRKSSASYYTKSFAVEHLLNRSLEPALNDHLSRIDEIEDDAEASQALFDFRIADIAMGSGHFLIAAIDHIERRFSIYLSERPLLGVREELNRLWRIAAENTGKDAEEMGIDHNHLLRRQIARRCVYGVDINPTAVELARVSVWIHTFVPGIPLSFLDWRLRCGNSIIGIATQDEANRIINEHGTQMSLFQDWQGDPADEVAEIARQMAEIGEGSDTTLEEVEEAMENYRRTRDRLSPWKALMDVMCAGRIEGISNENLGRIIRNWKADPFSVERDSYYSKSMEILSTIPPFHFQIQFPEVFWRENPGFDVLIGNPPWEKLHVEEHSWWGLHFPGLHRGSKLTKKQAIDEIKKLRLTYPNLAERFDAEVKSMKLVRSALKSGPYPGLGTAHIDLYQVFSWRCWDLCNSTGRVGLVLPRGALTGHGAEKWRRCVLEEGQFEEVSFLTNKSEWVFQGVHGSYSIALVIYSRKRGTTVNFCGPFFDLESLLRGSDDMASIPITEFLEWSNTVSFPYIPDEHAGKIMRKMKSHPTFHTGYNNQFKPLQGDMNATSDRDRFDLGEPSTSGRIPVLKGSSVNMWNPDAGEPYGSAVKTALLRYLLDKATKASLKQHSAYSGLEINAVDDLPITKCRIAFKDVTSPTNTRSAIFCLIPPLVSTVHSTPLLISQANTTPRDEAFILGILNSRIFDWYVRRWVELHLTFSILNSMPVPVVPESSPLKNRVVQLSAQLSAKDDRFSEWAKSLSVELGSLHPIENQERTFAEIDAICAILYGLEWDDVNHIIETFQRGWDYEGYKNSVEKEYIFWRERIGNAEG